MSIRMIRFALWVCMVAIVVTFAFGLYVAADEWGWL